MPEDMPCGTGDEWVDELDDDAELESGTWQETHLTLHQNINIAKELILLAIIQHTIMLVP